VTVITQLKSSRPLRAAPRAQWYRIDLHLHTPGSSDYQEPDVSYLDILRRAELRGLDIIAFTDHNTIKGYTAMMAEVNQLELLERLNRATPEERRRLADYRRLFDKILVLPGFEFTATFGFHILGLFSPQTSIRRIEHVLLSLKIPSETLDEGSSNVGASSDVLTAYRLINEEGGLVIAAHVNSAHGVAMRGMDFGGQTRIAYTQDPYLHALEVTDLESSTRSTTARFFDGRHTEYPRRMRCIQGSDAHRLIRDLRSDKNLGIGDRTTEVMMTECTFASLVAVFQSSDFALTRPYRGPAIEVYDSVQLARENGPDAATAFYPTLDDTTLNGIIADVCAMANGVGGAIYVGTSADPIEIPAGIEHLSRAIELIRGALNRLLMPAVPVRIEALETQHRVVMRLQVPAGNQVPYALDNSRIYVRNGAQTGLAERDQIIGLVMRQVTPAVPALAPPMMQPALSAPVKSAPDLESLSILADFSDSGNTASSSNGDNNRAAPSPRAPRSSQNRRLPAPLANRESRLPPIAAPPVESDSDLVTAEARPTGSGRPSREPPGSGGTPRTGVEIVGTETRKGDQYHIMRDLRNGNLVKDVTRSSARQLWQYAILERESHPFDQNTVQWKGNLGLIKRYRRNGSVRYDLAMRDERDSGSFRIFYGVSDGGLTGGWLQFASSDTPIIEEGGTSTEEDGF